MSAVHNERIKLTASLLNTLAGFSLTAGAIAPLIAISYGLAAAPAGRPLALIALVVTWLLVGSVFHWAARRLLGRLKP